MLKIQRLHRKNSNFNINLKKSEMITLYHPDDKDTVLNIFRANVPSAFSAKEEADLRNYLSQERDLYYVLQQPSGKIMGAGGINRFVDDEESARLSWDLLHPEYQGKGFGALLVQHRLEELHKDSRIRKVFVRTSQMAAPFYRKMGFQLLSTHKDFWDQGYHMHLMEISLRPS